MFQSKLMLVVTRPDVKEEIIASAIAGGVTSVQLRLREVEPARVRDEAFRIRALTAGMALMLVNGDADLAREVGADGVHYPEDAARGSVPDGSLITGRSAHSVDAAQRASEERCEYVLVGTIYDSSTHPDRAGKGPSLIRAVCDVVVLPVLAIGGITPERASACVREGASGIAVVSGLLDAADPFDAAMSYRAAIDSAWWSRLQRASGASAATDR